MNQLKSIGNSMNHFVQSFHRYSKLECSIVLGQNRRIFTIHALFLDKGASQDGDEERTSPVPSLHVSVHGLEQYGAENALQKVQIH